MAQSVLSDFWKSNHVTLLSVKEFLDLSQKLKNQPWENFSPKELLSILHTFCIYLNRHQKNSISYSDIKTRAWQPIESRLLSVIRKKSHEFEANESALCFKYLADLNVGINKMNEDLFKVTASSLLNYFEQKIESSNADNLRDFSKGILGLSLELLYAGENPKDDLIGKFFKQTVRLMLSKDSGFSDQHMNAITTMCDEMFIIPPDGFFSAAKEWESRQPQTKSLKETMDKVWKLGRFAFDAYVQRRSMGMVLGGQ